MTVTRAGLEYALEVLVMLRQADTGAAKWNLRLLAAPEQQARLDGAIASVCAALVRLNR